ncbi:MAG: hypothetical protein JWN17_765, partial [Frankiales bacterium]|nr:hypothetical protein [Frankiales bacterium]
PVWVHVLTGTRVVLRPLRDDDAEPLWRAVLDPVTWARTEERPLVPETLEAYVERRTARRKDGEVAAFAIDVDGVLVGQVALFAADPLARHASVGLTLLPEHRGQGHGRDALRVLVDYAFRSRNLRRVHLQTLASNEPALRAYRAVGFVEEGRLREHAWVEGAYDDVVLMALMRSDRER